MRRRALLAGLAALLVVTAGCASLPEVSLFGSGDEPIVHEERPDPDTDRIGWEQGYWHDDPVSVTASDGLNASERDAVVARAMARVEHVRDLEFESAVDVSLRSRENFTRNRSGGGSEAGLEAFDNAKFEALFLVGEDEGSMDVQGESRNQTVQGFYSPDEDAIVIVTDTETPTLAGPGTLAHELVHGLQDQHFGLSDQPGTRDAYNGQLGLTEGDANFVQDRYQDRCGETWACVGEAGPDAGGGDDSGTDGGDAGSENGEAADSLNMGVYLLQFFPYAEGPGLIAHLEADGGWAAVNEAYDRPPTNSLSVMAPERYGEFEPRNVSLPASAEGGWERVRPANRPDHAVLGPSAVTSSLARTLYIEDREAQPLIGARTFLNYEGNELNESDPLNYYIPAVRDWTGDRMQVYERDDDLAYVWRLTWSSPDSAAAFADTYRALLTYWGGDSVGDRTWTIDSGPFQDAFRIDVDGDTVTITNAPERGDLDDLAPGTT